MMKKLFSIVLLMLPMLMLAQSYQVATSRKAKICSSPKGKVLMTLPRCAECEVFYFNVVASKNGWLKISKSSFTPAEVILVNGQERRNTRYRSLSKIAGDCWVSCDDVYTGYPNIGIYPSGDKYYASPDLSSPCLGYVNPHAILEIDGDWVKVKGTRGTEEGDGFIQYGGDQTVVGWMYQPGFAVEICSA